MALKLNLMASHGYLPGVLSPQDQGFNRTIPDYQPFLPAHGARNEIMRLGSVNLKPECEEAWKPLSVLSASNHCVNIDSMVKKPMFTDVQDARPSSMLFSSALSEHCTRHEKILQMLMSGASERDEDGLNAALLSELIALQALRTDRQQESTPLIYPNTELYAQKPLVDFVGELVGSSRITIHPDGGLLFNGTRTEVKDLLSLVAEFYVPKSSAKGGKQAMLVPHYNWLRSSCVGVLDVSSLKLQTIAVAPLKSPGKFKTKSPKKKIGKKGGKERDLYKKNYFHACESLLSILVDKKKHGKTAILALKKSGSELPELLNGFSAGIAGTGLAVVFSVVCKLASSTVPFRSSSLFTTGLGFGLVWLSWAVNKLRDTTAYASKNSGKLGLKEEEVINRVDKSVKEIYFRALTVMAVAVLRFA